MEKDENPVSNPVALQRPTDACKLGLEKIETAIINADPLFSRQSAGDDDAA
jgi:hypothetical protein